MTFDTEVTAQRPVLRSHLAAARASIDVLKTTLVALRHARGADDKDRATLDIIVQRLDGAGTQLKSIEGMLADVGPSLDPSHDGRGG